MKISLKSQLLIFFITLLSLGPCYPSGEEEDELNLADELDVFFQKKLEFFHNVSASKYARSIKLRTSENYLRQVLKKQQPFYSILRVNTKGIVANEVTRQGEQPEENFRNIANQKGFQQVVKTKEPYYGLIKNEGGRHYLLWIDPLFNSKKKFVGAIMAKVDIWDCVHEFSQSTDIHFLVKIGNTSLYSHKWKNPKTPTKKKLFIPGVTTASILYDMPGSSGDMGDWKTVSDTFTTLEEKAAPVQDSQNVAEKAPPEPPTPATENMAPSQDPLGNSEANPNMQEKSKAPLLSAGRRNLLIAFIIGLITLILAVYMIKKANRERDRIL